jgi:hypothetical protein
LRSAFPQRAAHRHTVHTRHPRDLMLTHAALDGLTDSVIQLSR